MSIGNRRGRDPGPAGRLTGEPAPPSGRMDRRPAPGLLATLALGAGWALACQPATSRPYFGPVTGAPQVEVRLPTAQATRAFADLLRSDSIPLLRIEPRDGYIESAWFDVRSKARTRARPLGPSVVRVRAWIDPGRPGYSRLTAETVYRPLADPSVDQRSLDRQVPPDHPVGARMKALVEGMVRLYGGPESGSDSR